MLNATCGICEKVFRLPPEENTHDAGTGPRTSFGHEWFGCIIRSKMTIRYEITILPKDKGFICPICAGEIMADAAQAYKENTDDLIAGRNYGKEIKG